MATVRRSVATLRVTGDELRPGQISKILGHEPTSAQTKGETLIGKKTGIARVAKFGMWRLEAAEREPADLDAQVEEILSKLTTDLNAWQSVTSVHTADLFCGLFMNRTSEGIELSPKSLSALGSRGIVLGLDIYAGDGDSDA